MEQNSQSISFSTVGKSGNQVEESFASTLTSSSSEQRKETSSSMVSGFSSFSEKVGGSSSSTTSFMTKPSGTYKPFNPQPPSEQHGLEIKQENLKNTIQSAITDLEHDLVHKADFSSVADDKENQAPDESDMPELQPINGVAEEKKGTTNIGTDTHSHKNGILNGHVETNGFEKKPEEPSQSGGGKLRLPHEFKGRPNSYIEENPYVPDKAAPLELPEVGKMKTVPTRTNGVVMEEREEHTLTTSSQFQSSTHESSEMMTIQNGEQFSSNEIMNKVMTPAGDESYDTGSLKRRNPRQMYTDSAFYNPKHHPSVAEQVEMAHRLSSSLYDDGNKMSHGQEMFLKRAKKSGKWIHAEDPDFAPEDPDIPPHHDRVPNLKLVMNPEGKLHDWTDLPENELPDMTNIAAMGSTPEVAHHVIENLEQCKGRGGQLFAKRRKRADNWVIDESSVGKSGNPGNFAESFVQQQSSFETVEQRSEVVSSFAEETSSSSVFSQQQTFQEQQELKQQQSLEIRQQQEQESSHQRAMIAAAPNVDLPEGVKHCNLRSRPFTPSMDLSCHNTQGIDVWANKAPKAWTSFNSKASTLPRTASKSMSGVSSSSTIEYNTQIQQKQMYEEELRIKEEERKRQQTLEQEKYLEEKRKFDEMEKKKKELEAERKKLEEQKRQHVENAELQRQEEAEYQRQQKEAEFFRQQQELQRQQQEAELQRQQQEAELHRQQQEVELQRQQHESEMARQEAELQKQRQEAELLRQQQDFAQQEALQRQKQEEEKLRREEELRREEQLRKQAEEKQRMEAEARQLNIPKVEVCPATPQVMESGGRLEMMSSSSMSSSTIQQSSKSETFSSHENTMSSEIPYSQSLNPTSPGTMIRQEGSEINYTQAEQTENSEPDFAKVQLKKTPGAIFGGIAGDRNSLIDENFDYEKHSVRNLVDHFSKTKPGSVPLQYLPQQYSQSEDAPPLSYLHEQAKKKSYSYREKIEYKKDEENTSTETVKKSSTKKKEEKVSFESRRRNSLKDYLLMDSNDQANTSESEIADPSAILRVDGLINDRRSQSKILEDGRSPNESETNKWDNHNTIARGWQDLKTNYAPVTFRKKYHIEGQKPIQSLRTSESPATQIVTDGDL